MTDPLRQFAEETEPDLESVARIRMRLDDAPLAAPPLGRALFAGVGLGAAVAAVAIVAAVVIRSPDAPGLDRELVAEAGPVVVEPTPGLTLRLDGVGHLDGTPAEPRIEWQAGTLGVEVDPGARLSVRIQTHEGALRVVGTAFEVVRNALGTTVNVDRGSVALTCEGGAEQLLGPGSSEVCLPTTAAAMLAKARHLQDSGAPAEAVIGSVEAGRSLPGAEGAVLIELGIVEVEALETAGRVEEALEKARWLSESPGHRSDEVSELLKLLEARLQP